MTVKYKCPGCGADAGCNCGLPPILKARQAITENPGKSDRAIAADMGISHQTVARARKGTGPRGPVENRKGKDGKVRKMPTPKSVNYDPTGGDNWKKFNTDINEVLHGFQDRFKELILKGAPPNAATIVSGLHQLSDVLRMWATTITEKENEDVEV